MSIKDRPRAALIFGGRGLEHDVSVKGAEYVFPLIDEKFEKILLYITRDGRWLKLSTLNDATSALGEECYPTLRGIIGAEGFERIDVAFPLLHGDYGEDGVVQGALECAMIPYVGCDVHSSAVARDKCLLKLIARELGINTAEWVEYNGDIESTASLCEEKLGYPLFVKPARLGSSVGVARAESREELTSAIKNAARLGSGRVIIEEYIKIERELECAYFSSGGKEIFTHPGEIVCDGGFYDFDKKYVAQGASVSPCARVSESIANKVIEHSKALVKKIGLSGISRLDFFLSIGGTLYFNEINTMPGFTESSLYPALIEGYGIPARELISSLLSEKARRP